MYAKGYLWGHPIIYVKDAWYYSDTMTKTIGTHRECKHCGKGTTEEGHDGCLGTLKGAMNACCGHGNIDQAYYQFEDGSCIRGEEALDMFIKLKGEQQ